MELISVSKEGKVTWENGVCLGNILADVDGYYKFWPDSNNGYWDELLLDTISNKLKEMNKAWDAEIEQYFSKSS